MEFGWFNLTVELFKQIFSSAEFVRAELFNFLPSNRLSCAEVTSVSQAHIGKEA
jgi:hypothetical protein